MTDLKHLKAKLGQRRRRERKKVNDRYRAMIKQAEKRCTDHIFGDWEMRWDGLTNFYRTNFRGQPFEFRDCDHCGKTESRLKENP